MDAHLKALENFRSPVCGWTREPSPEPFRWIGVTLTRKEMVWADRNDGKRGLQLKFSTGSCWVLPAETRGASTQESENFLSLTTLTQATEALRRGRKAQLNA